MVICLFAAIGAGDHKILRFSHEEAYDEVVRFEILARLHSHCYLSNKGLAPPVFFLASAQPLRL